MIAVWRWCKLVALCSLLLVSMPLLAETVEAEPNLQPILDLSGSLRGAYYSGSRKLDEQHDLGVTSAWLKAASKLGNNFSMFAEGWVRNEESLRADATTSKLREGYLDFSAGSTDVRLGKQMIVWGRADELNPTDNLTPRDFTMLTPETDEQRFGTVAAKVAYHVHDYALIGAWLPDFHSNIFPLAATPGVYYTHASPQHVNQVALKLEHTGGEIDWSISYFDGLDLNPDIRIGAFGPSGLNVMLENKRIKVAGMDAATVVGHYGVRAEAAYTWTESNGDPLIKKPFFYAVIGADRTFSDQWYVNLQYYLRRVTGYQDPRNIADPVVRPLAVQGAILSNQIDRFQHGLSMHIGDKWLNDTLEAEVEGVLSMTRHDYAIKPKLTYAFNDQVKGTLGIDVFRGQNDTYMGNLRKMSLAYFEIRCSF
jgi:hypothetical protein